MKRPMTAARRQQTAARVSAVGSVLIVVTVAIISRAGQVTPAAEMLLWALLAVGTGVADRLLHSESPPDSGGVAGFVGPMVLMVGAGFVAYFIARFTLGPDAAAIIGPAFGGTSFILARFWVANRQQGRFVFEDTFGPDLTALTLLHVVFVLLLTESVAVNYVGGVTAIIVNHVGDTPVFNPTFIYGLTTTAFAAPAFFLGAFFVGRLTYHILHRKVWAWLALVVLLWVVMRALLASSSAGQQELASAQINLSRVAILGTLLAYLVLLLLVLRLGHWSSRFVVTRRRVNLPADQGPPAVEVDANNDGQQTPPNAPGIEDQDSKTPRGTFTP